MANERFDGFPPATLEFLHELALNNNRDWFGENKHRYESQVLDPALAFIDAMQAPLAKISPHLTAVPKRVGGSLMRVYRDTRFSKNKQPYKTNVGIQFRHEQGKDVHAPGYYVHIDPDQVFIGAGMWHPESGALRAIRERIVEAPDEWRKVKNGAAFRRHFELGGESLKRAPKGFDPGHPLIEDLRRKDFIAVKNLDHAVASSADFQQEITAAFRAAVPFMRFLCRAIDVPF